MNILLYSSGSAGDILPFIRTGYALRQCGHRVTVLTHAGYADLAKRAGLGYVPIDTESQYKKFMSEVSLLNTPRHLPEFIRKHCLEPLPHIMHSIEQHCGEDSLLITPPLYDVVTRLVRERTGVPTMWLHVAPAQAKGGQMLTALFSKVLAPDINQLRIQLGLKPVTQWNQWLSYSSPSIGLWPDWFGSPEPGWLEGLTPVGFIGDLHAERTQLAPSVENFLDQYPSPVLITGGTGAFHGKAFYAAALDAVSATGKAAIVATRYRDALPGNLPTKVMHCDGAPFGVLMPKLSAIIHHGGIGTTSAAIAASLPQLILGYGLDRPDNGMRVARLNLGKIIAPPRWQVEHVAAALTDLVESESIRASCERHADLMRASDVVQHVCKVVERFVAGNHSGLS